MHAEVDDDYDFPLWVLLDPGEHRNFRKGSLKLAKALGDSEGSLDVLVSDKIPLTGQTLLCFPWDISQSLVWLFCSEVICQ